MKGLLTSALTWSTTHTPRPPTPDVSDLVGVRVRTSVFPVSLTSAPPSLPTHSSDFDLKTESPVAAQEVEMGVGPEWGGSEVPFFSGGFVPC